MREIADRCIASGAKLDYSYLSKLKSGTCPPGTKEASAGIAKAIGKDPEVLEVLRIVGRLEEPWQEFLWNLFVEFSANQGFFDSVDGSAGIKASVRAVVNLMIPQGSKPAVFVRRARVSLPEVSTAEEFLASLKQAESDVKLGNKAIYNAVSLKAIDSNCYA